MFRSSADWIKVTECQLSWPPVSAAAASSSPPSCSWSPSPSCSSSSASSLRWEGRVSDTSCSNNSTCQNIPL